MGRLRKNHKIEKQLYLDDFYYVKNPFAFKGEWNKKIFNNNHPIHIEIGTGKGNFILNQALKNPGINFIAIDKFATVLGKLYLKLIKLDKKIFNLKIIVCDAKDILLVFGLYEISYLFLNFTDPWPKKHHEKYRLTNHFFLDIYLLILKENATISFKTDNYNFFLYSLNMIKQNKFNFIYVTANLYQNKILVNDSLTEYETKWIKANKKIYHILFRKKN